VSSVQIINADVLDSLRRLPDQSIQCCITSPPYWGLRDYGVVGQIGLEPTPEEYVEKMVEVFREVRRVLRDDGTLWLNLGDSYNGSGGAGGDYAPGGLKAGQPKYPGRRISALKPKDLVGIPWRVAFALQEDGWYLRSDIIWHKPNPMPESVRDRPTKAHEYMFLLTKSGKYYYDADAVREPCATSDHERGDGNGPYRADHFNHNPLGRNRRDVWTIPTRPYKGAHFATFPPALVEPCLLAGSKAGDAVLDPFGGSGTVGAVATEHGRDAVLIELNPDYIPLIEKRVAEVQA
jgi:DNA modification methylase